MSKYTAAESYAKALLTLTSDKEQLTQRLGMLEKVQKRLESYPKLVQLMEAPDRTKEELQKLVHCVLMDNEDPLLERYIALLVKKKRLYCLEEILRLYRISGNRTYGIQLVTAITAMPLENEALDALQNMLQEGYPDKKIEVSVQIDPSVLGGLALIIDHKMIDGTIKGQLANLKDKLLVRPGYTSI